MKAYLTLLINAIILIALGVYGYILSGSPTALISSGIGAIMLILVMPVKKENSVAAHIAVALTLLSAITFFVIGLRRANNLVVVMGVITTVAFILFLLDFIKRKKERAANKN